MSTMRIKAPWLRFIEGEEGGQVSEKQSEPDNPESPDTPAEKEEDPAPEEPPADGGDWEAKYKASREHTREWESRARSNQKELDEVRKELETAHGEKSTLEHGVTVWKVLAESGLKIESAKFLEKLPDEESMRELAEELSGAKPTVSTKITRVKDPEPPAESGVELFDRARKRLTY